ncbi:bifunctional transcriptional activator/DNA repair enzyme AdaA [Cohnella zeiphila]|uniref:Methylphosphotriester-DNA--protein-cysteine methyltransferase family protein n=1 Tax=Cohnella zeiphila TaxID=2761120 RepID=A0A7X0ST78_9BACL|nr:bifunctional transcriptional activator/DNA repair enzyme AdaA [Cohnella zeiphila]MBB6735665.1 methylphosphotriester-DNA--protein-cysteine methyltransferase family protein [Cohnella zeiphila]
MKEREFNGAEPDTVPDDEQWRAIVSNDESCNGKFFYAVKTTGIFCRPSCKSKEPRRENVVLFDRTEQALAGGFRPCKRCKPTGETLPDAEWVTQMTSYIDRHYAEPITLQSLADQFHGSPYHLQRIFKKVQGATPVAYVQRTRAARAAELLSRTDRPIAQIGAEVGISSAPYFITLFKSVHGCTPAAYRRRFDRPHNEEEINHASARSDDLLG